MKKKRHAANLSTCDEHVNDHAQNLSAIKMIERMIQNERQFFPTKFVYIPQ